MITLALYLALDIAATRATGGGGGATPRRRIQGTTRRFAQLQLIVKN